MKTTKELTNMNHPKPDSVSSNMHRYTLVHSDGLHYEGSCFTLDKAIEIAKAIGGTVRDIASAGRPIVYPVSK